jgi:hypothetical protein
MLPHAPQQPSSVGPPLVLPPDLPFPFRRASACLLATSGPSEPHANLPRLLIYTQIHHNTRVPAFAASRLRNRCLKFAGLVMELGLWETGGMAKKITVGQVVVSAGMVGVYRVVGVSGETADIEKFDISKQKSLGDPVRSVAVNKLTAYKEDASQTAARIVRETTEEEN